jgi:hypothetical protein
VLVYLGHIDSIFHNMSLLVCRCWFILLQSVGDFDLPHEGHGQRELLSR